MFLWCGNGASLAVHAVLIGYVTIYCTNALGMSEAVVGTLLMVNKIFDGITDLFAGFIVDRTNTKIGRGRPYDLCIIGLWITTWLLFSVPASMTETMKCAWIFICYTLCQSVFKTFLSAAGTPYMVRAFNNDQKYVKLSSWGGLLTTCVVIVFNVIFPMFYGGVVGFKYFDFKNPSGIQVRVQGTAKGEIRVYTKLDEKDKLQDPVAAIAVNSTDGSGASVFSGTVQDLTGCKPLYFVFHGTGSLRFEAFTIQCVS